VKPRQIVDIGRERWRLLLAGLLLGVVVAGLVTYFVPREYSSSITMIVTTQPDPAITATAGSDEVSAQRISTYTELMGSRRLAGEVITALRLPETPEQLANRVSVTTTPDSALIAAAVTDSSPDQAVRIANAIGDAFIRDVAQIEQPADPAARPPVVAKVFQPAVPPADLVAPRPLLYLAGGVVLGLLIGFAAAAIRSALDTRVKSRNQLEEILGAPVLGAIGRDRTMRSSPLRMYGASHTPLAEAFGHLRTNLQVAAIERQRKTILVASATSGEGRTATVCNLGLALAKTGAHVLIVDADLRHPSVAGRLGVPDAPGLIDALDTAASAKTFVRPVRATLDALPSGLCPPNPSEVLGSQRMTDLLTSLRDAYDVVLIDAAPLLPVTDAAVLASRVDGVLVVVRHGRTRVQDVCAARDALHVVDGRILGSVLTMVGHTGPRRRTRLTRFRSVSRAWSPIGRPSVNGASRAAPPVPTAPPPPPVPAPALPPEPFRPSPRPRSNPDALAEPSNGDGSPKPSERDGSPKSADGDGQSETSVVDEAVDRGSAAR